VITQKVAVTGNDRVFEAVGTGRARSSVEIYPAVSDEVTEVLFQTQERVSRGQLLVRLDDREELLAVRLAEVELKDARSLLERYEKAVKQGGVPESEVDSARATFEAAEVALDQARLELEKHQVKAPFDGVVGIPNVDPGDRVDPGRQITTLDDRAILHVEFEVPEVLAGALGEEGNAAVTATTPAHPGMTFDATVTAQGSRVDPRRRTLLVRADIENENDLLRPGMSFATRWAIAGERYPTAPEISLQWGRNGSFVWTIRDGKAERVAVRVVARSGGRILVEGELRERDVVVIEGLQRLRPGVAVEVLGEREHETAG
jgi:RND family efflux transporter MFP subunit